MERMTQDKFVEKVFTRISPHYDLLNHMISWGMDSKWRRACAKTCLDGGARRVLDLGCGTGELTLEIARTARDDIQVCGVDLNEEMLKRAEEKAVSLPQARSPSFIRADAASLPFADAYFDAIVNAFVLRNLAFQDRQARKYLQECRRVLVPGGRLVVLETSQPNSKLVRWFYHLYLSSVVKGLGLMWGKPDEYGYLAYSASRFYSPQELRPILEENGFKDISYRGFLFGAVGLYTGVKA